MRKHRSWLMGLGIGLILGASMLQLIITAKEQAEGAAELPMTREQLEKEAGRANFVVYPASETLYTEEQLQAKLDEAAKATKEPEPSASAAPPEAEQSPSDAPKAEETDAEPVKLYVKANMSLQEVGDKLEELGVVADGQDFVSQSKAIAKSLDVGTAVFVGQPSYEEIRQELTRKKP